MAGRAAAVAAGCLVAYGTYRLARYHIFGKWEWVRVGHVSSLHVYPVKSCRGTEVEEMDIGLFGPVNDRVFVVVDENGRFITQRQNPEMALISPSIPSGGSVVLSAPGMSHLKVATTGDGAPVDVGIWDDEVSGVDQGASSSKWLSDYMQRPVRLIGIPKKGYDRPTSSKWSPAGGLNQASYADGFPVLIANEASLRDLNQRMEKAGTPALPMNRFRPNIVVGGIGLVPWEEDRWREVRVGSERLAVVKPCTRCKVTTTDQETTERGAEPLKTMASFRRKWHVGTRAGDRSDVFFGQNC
eukprot:CAMPEP_0174943438 /NCGR_PEP_ID=MMETSP1355-20121228/76684_1 /TAXON_ID=464990 /ORGANISM="Hemiselmis tepida, Strain CCMP443" /LENGTH=298 /DNA_ID=CAMNT_0016190685 /DNA_START=165 /DNA_END=1058 /DNA_ORIENTATION=-